MRLSVKGIFLEGELSVKGSFWMNDQTGKTSVRWERSRSPWGLLLVYLSLAAPFCTAGTGHLLGDTEPLRPALMTISLPRKYMQQLCFRRAFTTFQELTEITPPSLECVSCCLCRAAAHVTDCHWHMTQLSFTDFISTLCENDLFLMHIFGRNLF